MRTASIVLLLCLMACTLAAQSPNTSSLIIGGSDQSGAILSDAAVSVLNTATGDHREAITGADGQVTFTGLSVAGTYRVVVQKPGFTSATVDNIVLRAGETADIHVKLVMAGDESSVDVFGTVAGVSTSPELGTRLDSQQIDDTPIIGRKISAVPLLNGAFRNAKGTPAISL